MDNVRLAWPGTDRPVSAAWFSLCLFLNVVSLVPVNGVFVPLDGICSRGRNAAAAVGELVWSERSGSGQVYGMQGAVVVMVRVSIHPSHWLQPVVGHLFILEQTQPRNV